MAVTVRAVVIFVSLLSVAVMMSGCDDAKHEENKHVATHASEHEQTAPEAAKAAARKRAEAGEKRLEKAAQEAALEKKRAARAAAAQRDKDEARDEAVAMRAEAKAERKEMAAEGLVANERARVRVHMPTASAIVDNAPLLATVGLAAAVGVLVSMLWRGAQVRSRVVISESLLG